MLAITSSRKDNFDPLVSIVIFTYNHVNYIARCLESVFSQTIFDKSEVIIYDDCSNDGTSEIIFELIGTKENIIYIRAKENLFSRKINVTWIPFQYATSDICAYLDGDDLWTAPDKNLLQLEEITKNRSCGMVICGWHETDLSGRIIRRSNTPNYRVEYLRPYNKIVSGEFITIQSSSMMFRKSLLGDFINDYRIAPPVGDLLMQVACSRDNNIVDLGFDGVNRIRSKGINTYLAAKAKRYIFSRKNWDFRMRLMKSNLERFSHSDIRLMVNKYLNICLLHSFSVNREVYPEKLRLRRQLGYFYQFKILFFTTLVRILQIISCLRGDNIS